MTTTPTRPPTARELLGSLRWEAIYQELDMTQTQAGYIDANGKFLRCNDRVIDAGGNHGWAEGNRREGYLDIRWDDGTVSQVLPGQLVRVDDEDDDMKGPYPHK